MKDTQILSTFPQTPAPAAGAAGSITARVLDTCHVGVVLRAVLFVQGVMAIGAMFDSPGWQDWLNMFAVQAGSSLPATLAWLITSCALKRVLGRRSLSVQVAVGVVLGGLAGVYGCAILYWVGLVPSMRWAASACLGAALAAALMMVLVLRAKAHAPAAAAARLSELQSRIRPHFLFNALNSAIALVRAEPARAEAVLEDLSELFREALSERGDSVSLADELLLARRYLAIEQVRFGDRLQLDWVLDAAADHARLPPLLLQPLVENAVRHGVEPSPEGAQVRISTRRRGSTVVIKVSNTLPAGAGKPGHGLALANVRERLSLLHDLQGQFTSGRKGDVYEVRIEVPA
jgi:two-component system sensor histidine kinase AlgZ